MAARRAYKGTATGWNSISIYYLNDSLLSATRYYYSETEPTAEGDFWHYVDGEIVVWPKCVDPTISVRLGYTLNNDGISYSVTGIGTCTDTDIVISSTYNGLPVTGIGGAFVSCANLTSITIPDSVTSIGDYTFDGCISLVSIVVDANNEYYMSIDGNLYSKDGKTLIQYAIGKADSSFIIPNSVTSIDCGAFSYCTSLTSIIIPDSVTSIGDCAFLCCTSLTSITIPDSVTSIGHYAFDECTSLTSIIIPDSVTSIGDYAFAVCTSLTSITIPANVTSIGISAFERCSNLADITVDVNNEYYMSIDGNLYSKDGKTLIRYAIGKADSTFIIPDGVEYIGVYAFWGCTSLTSITIPYGVTKIGGCAFAECTSLVSITIPDGVTSIDWGAFYGCTSLTSITIPDSVTRIGYYAIFGCTSLNTVYYKGTAIEWNAISISGYNDSLLSATRYYYSETAPTEEGNFWHYVDGEIVVW